MDTSSLVLGLRVLLSLACVLGLIWYANRRLAGPGAVRRQRAAAMSVVSRQSLGGKNGLALVDVGGRRLLLGVGEQGVSLLTEVQAPAAEPEDEPADDRVPLTAEELAELAGDDLQVEIPSDVSGLTDPSSPVPSRTPVHTPAPAPAPTTGPVRPEARRTGHPLPPSTPAARTPAVTEPRNPLEGSILDAATWRRAVVAVQERTIRR